MHLINPQLKYLLLHDVRTRKHSIYYPSLGTLTLSFQISMPSQVVREDNYPLNFNTENKIQVNKMIENKHAQFLQANKMTFLPSLHDILYIYIICLWGSVKYILLIIMIGN